MKLTKFSSLALTLLILAGCGTTPSNTATEEAIVTLAAQNATVLVLQKNPKYRPDFVAGSALLGTIASGTNELTPAVVNAALEASGQTNQVVNLVILNGVTILDAYARSATTNSTLQTATTKTGAGWIQTGITQGLALVPPR